MPPMKAQAMTAFGAPLTPMDLTPAKPGPGEALVKVTRVGLCHSDLHIHDGYFSLGGGAKAPVAIDMPAVLGHEIEGEVAELGQGVTGPPAGTRVAVYPWLGCGACAACARGDQQLCVTQPRRALGVARWGGMAEYVHVPVAEALIPIDGLAPGVGALAMCSGLTAFSALKKIGAPPQDEPVVLIGMGGVGLAALALARASLPNPIFAADIDPVKREAARSFGAHEVLDPSAPEAIATLLNTKGPAAAAIDFVGAPESFAFGTGVLRRGGTYIIVGLFGGQAPLPLATLPLRALTIAGSYVGRLDEARDLIALLRAGKTPAPLMSERPLEAANSAFEDLRAGKVVGRIVLRP